jgi:hypothetical protein
LCTTAAKNVRCSVAICITLCFLNQRRHVRAYFSAAGAADSEAYPIARTHTPKLATKYTQHAEQSRAEQSRAEQSRAEHAAFSASLPSLDAAHFAARQSRRPDGVRIGAAVTQLCTVVARTKVPTSAAWITSACACTCVAFRRACGSMALRLPLPTDRRTHA